MKIHHIIKILLIWVFFYLFFINNTQWYYFWLKSSDNTPENISSIESALNIKLPIVSFIFDPRNESDVLNSIDKIVGILGNDRIYHITISPDMYNADEVVMWKFDKQYTAFFNKIKEKNLHIIFRTMHEMNGGRYPRSSNPEKFKAAWIHVWSLSRVAWLNENNIAFDFSVNHRDMPTKEIPSQSASLIQCTQKKNDCYHFEDYYPWDEFVDVIWFTFYNRWKAQSNRKWLSPTQILFDPNWNTYNRILSFGKPIIIDEVATTSVRYDWDYNYEKSRKEYLNHNERKDYWLHQLLEFFINHPDIIAAIYFNTDYTHWLSFIVTWEADWAIINLDEWKVYDGFWDLELFWEKDLNNILNKVFHLSKFTVDNKTTYISSTCNREFTTILSIIKEKADTDDKKISLIKQLQQTKTNSDCINQTLNSLLKLYSE